MKNKKKLITGIVILLIVSVSCLLGILFTIKSKMKVAESVENHIIEDNTPEETVENIDTEENEQLEKSLNEENAEVIIEEKEDQQQPKTESNQPTETSQVSASKSNDSEKKATTVNPQQTQSQQPIQNEKQQTAQQSSASSQKQTTAQTQSTQTQSSQTQSTQTQKKPEGEKYVRNDTMINTIKKVINNNKSENMKTYGYTIQVDPSIKNQTNQFTYTESRVINLIKYSFGTIRVYAEDYYNNGQLIMTECYIF